MIQEVRSNKIWNILIASIVSCLLSPQEQGTPHVRRAQPRDGQTRSRWSNKDLRKFRRKKNARFLCMKENVLSYCYEDHTNCYSYSVPCTYYELDFKVKFSCPAQKNSTYFQSSDSNCPAQKNSMYVCRITRAGTFTPSYPNHDSRLEYLNNWASLTMLLLSCLTWVRKDCHVI